MSLEAARAYLHRIKRGVRSTTRASCDWARGRYDCETVLMVVAEHGNRAGYDFTDEEYRIAATQEVEAMLGSGQLPDEGELLVFSHDLVDGGGDYLVFRRGVREEDGTLVFGAHHATLVGGSVR